MNRFIKVASAFLFFYLIYGALAYAQKSLPANSFNYDKSVSGISLQNGKSTSLVLGNNVWEKRFEKDDDFGFIRVECLNINAKQLLRIGFFEGGTKNEVQVFQVSYKPKTYALSSKTVKTKIPEFISGLKIKLGMSEQQVMKIVGDNCKVSGSKGLKVLNWHTTDAKSSVLKNYQAIGYFIEGKFNSKDQLVEYSFGFDYP